MRVGKISGFLIFYAYDNILAGVDNRALSPHGRETPKLNWVDMQSMLPLKGCGVYMSCQKIFEKIVALTLILWHSQYLDHSKVQPHGWCYIDLSLACVHAQSLYIHMYGAGTHTCLRIVQSSGALFRPFMHMLSVLPWLNLEHCNNVIANLLSSLFSGENAITIIQWMFVCARVLWKKIL